MVGLERAFGTLRKVTDWQGRFFLRSRIMRSRARVAGHGTVASARLYRHPGMPTRLS